MNSGLANTLFLLVALLSSPLSSQASPKLTNTGSSWRFPEVPAHFDVSYQEGKAWVASQGKLMGFQPYDLDVRGASVELPISDHRRFFNMAKWRNGRLFCRSGERIYAWDQGLATWELWLESGRRFMSFEIGPDGSVLLVGPMDPKNRGSSAWFYSRLTQIEPSGTLLELYPPHSTEPQWSQALPEEFAATAKAIPNLRGIDLTWCVGGHVLMYSSDTGFLFQFTWATRRFRALNTPWPKLDKETLAPVLDFARKSSGKFKEIYVAREGFADMDVRPCPASPDELVWMFRTHRHTTKEFNKSLSACEGTGTTVALVGLGSPVDAEDAVQPWRLAVQDLETGDLASLEPLVAPVTENNWYWPDGRGMPVEKVLERVTRSLHINAEEGANKKPIPTRIGARDRIADPPEGWEALILRSPRPASELAQDQEKPAAPPVPSRPVTPQSTAVIPRSDRK